MTSDNQKRFAAVKPLARKLLIGLLLIATVAVAVGFAYAQVYTVQIIDEGQQQTVRTTKQTPAEILEQFGYVVNTEDDIAFSGFSCNEGTITITRAFPVTVHCDGEETVVMTTGDDVAGILSQADVTLGEWDQVDCPLQDAVQPDMRITVTRQQQRQIEQKVKVPFEVQAIPTSLLAPGMQKVLVYGSPGLSVETYTQLVVDGDEQQPVLQEEEILQEPVTQQVLVGETAYPISTLDFGYQFDANGEPIGYKSVLRNQPAAGYSAKAGALTASGRPAVVGHVAVDPNVIPYGAKLYIKSTDGSFVYGYAVAADTGTAIKDGLISVDLFYGSYTESALNGIKQVDIFILE